MDDRSAVPAYQELLREALELGRLDGLFAATFEPPAPDGDRPGRCLGRTPAEFALLLWEGRPGTPPAGLEQNAPLWYAAGYTESLDAVRRPRQGGATNCRRRPSDSRSTNTAS